MDASHIVFIHGSSGDKSNTYKAVLMRTRFPGMLTPDFDGDIQARMAKLISLLGNEKGWSLVGSSLGGLMATLFAMRAPGQLKKLILLAPALTLPEFADHLPDPIPVPTIIVQGTKDELIPWEVARSLAERVFINLKYMLVDDDHRLHKTAETLAWESLLS
jgi:pimeloyl-ACP methyl ester carboxylesterase